MSLFSNMSMSKDNNNGVIIIGGHVQGLGIARILGKLGNKIIVMDSTPHNIARRSKYCNKFIEINNDTLLEELILIGKSGLYKNYIIFPTNDLYVFILSKNKELLSQYFILAADDWEVVEKTYNKRLTYNIAKKIGVPIANTWMPNNIQEIDSLNPDFPCIIKPAVMHSFYSKLKKKVFLCKDKTELIENYKRAISVIPANEVIVQSVIKSDSSGLYSVCFLHNKDKEIQYFVGRRARQHPPDFGNATTLAQIVDNEVLVEMGKRLLTEIGYTGVCEVEFMMDTSDNLFKFLEINPRTWKWHSIAELANINMLENYTKLLMRQPVLVNGNTKKASFRHLVTDIPTLLEYKLLKLYKKYPKYPVQYAVWDINDIKPFVFELINLPLNILKR